LIDLCQDDGDHKRRVGYRDQIQGAPVPHRAIQNGPPPQTGRRLQSGLPSNEGAASRTRRPPPWVKDSSADGQRGQRSGPPPWLSGQSSSGDTARRDRTDSQGYPDDYRSVSFVGNGNPWSSQNNLDYAQYPSDRNMASRRPRSVPEQKSEKNPAKFEDTTIGKGFTAQLKRGVNQVQPKPGGERTEMVKQKDGGFIATIQKGFEGIFGHLASTKEEVLKKRGPMIAPEYEAVPGDDLDQRVMYYAHRLPEHLGECLPIYRVSKGEYQIGSDDVRLAWQSKILPDGRPTREVFVYGKDEGDAEPIVEPLPSHLKHAANVAFQLQNGNAVSQVPDDMRLSFPDQSGTGLKELDSDKRFNAMALATEQARLREEAALQWRRNNPSTGPNRLASGNMEAAPQPSASVEQRELEMRQTTDARLHISRPISGADQDLIAAMPSNEQNLFSSCNAGRPHVYDPNRGIALNPLQPCAHPAMQVPVHQQQWFASTGIHGFQGPPVMATMVMR